MVLRSLPSRFLRVQKFLLKALFCVVFLFCVLVASLFLLCHYKGDTVCAIVEVQLQQLTGYQWKLGNVRPSIFPVPGVAFDSVAMHDDGPKRLENTLFSSSRLVIEPDFLALLQGRAGIRHVQLDSPLIQLRPSPAPVNAEYSAPSAGDHAAPEPAASGGATGLTDQTRGQETPAEKTAEAGSAAGVDPHEALAEAVADVFSSLKQLLLRENRQRLARFTLHGGRLVIFARDGSIDVDVSDIELAFRSSGLRSSQFSARLDVPFVGLSAGVEGNFSLPARGEDRLAADLSGTVAVIPPESREIAAKFSTRLAWKRQDDTVTLSDLAVEAEGDVLKGSFAFDPTRVAVEGAVSFPQLSLTRWFFFARNLPPGLQEALHGLSGTAEVRLTPTGAYVENITAMAASIPLSGRVWADNFAVPVVNVQVDMPKANLDDIFPFLATLDHKAPEPVEPTFTMPHLIPFPGPAGDDAPEVGYDVHIRVGEITVHALPGGPLKVAVFPMGGTMTRITLEENTLAGGAIKGRLDIDRPRVEMSFDFTGLDLAQLPENIGSSVIFGGKATGNVTLDVPVSKGHWSNEWGITAKGRVANQSITLTGKSGWGITAASADIKGKGVVHTLKSRGLRLEGLWNIDAANVFSTWHKGGKEKLQADLKGSLAWPPSDPAARRAMPDLPASGGIYHIYGDLVARGLLSLPLGEYLVPVEGTLHSPMDWRIDKNILKLSKYTFDGLGSVVKGDMTIDSSGKATVLTSGYTFTMNPRTVMTRWNMLPEAIQIPKAMSGKGAIRSDENSTLFSGLDFKADNAPVKGTVTITQSHARKDAKNNHILWEPKLAAEHIDFDNYLPPPPPGEKDLPPSKKPWELAFLKGMDMDLRMTFAKAHFRGFNFNETEVTGAMTKGRFRLTSLTADMYGGRSTIQLTGLLDAAKSTVRFDRANVMFKGVNLTNMFNDFSEVGDYGGRGDLVFDVSGLMGCNADFPGGLSGQWSMAVHDGIYPAFLGSESAGLRNTFALAEASGAIEKGVLKSDNFVLDSTMVDMRGGGWADFVRRALDIKVSVTLAGIPTVPVRFHGPFSTMTMSVQGGNMVVDTAQAAGSTIFNVFRGIIELPIRAVRGVGSLFSSDGSGKKQVYTPQPPSTPRPATPKPSSKRPSSSSGPATARDY